MINWKLRLKNKTTLITLTTLCITFVYQILSAVGVTPKVSQDMATQIIMAVVNVLAVLGVIVDPTTKGVSDSLYALTYEEPKESPKGKPEDYHIDLDVTKMNYQPTTEVTEG